MKKMYLAIFLIILVVLVFAGCKSFMPSFELTTAPTEDDFQQGEIPGGNEVPGNSGGNNQVITPGEQNTLPQGSGDVATTAPVGNQGGSNEGPSVPNNAPQKSEYDILKSGSFYMTGSMVDSSGMSSPMEVAVTPNSVYMLADFEGEAMGMLVADDCVYMIYPAKKAYLELSDSIMSMAGLDIDDLISTDQINFGSYGELSEADSVTEEAHNGKACQVYHFVTSEGGESRVFMNGTEIVRIASYDKNGKFLTSTDIENITGSVPADKSAPPKSYKAYKGITGMMSFMTLLGDVMQ